MKAIVWTKYGSPDGLQLREVNQPMPGDNDVLIKVFATSVTAGDVEVRSLKFPPWLALPIRMYMGLLRPRNKVLGQELAGEIEAIGRNVSQFRVGDQVFGATGFGFGAYAEYISLPAVSADGALAVKPVNQRYEEAAAIPVAGLEALHYLRKANIQSGQKVLVYGAGGSIGTVAVQLAKYFGAVVTAVDSAGKLDMLRSIGADHVIDYRKEDFTTQGERYDVIVDVIGKSPFRRGLRSLKENGVYLLINAGLAQKLMGIGAALTGSKRVISGVANRAPEDLLYLKELIEAGKLKSVIDRSFSLEQTAEAHRYVETGQKRGNVVITVARTDEA